MVELYGSLTPSTYMITIMLEETNTPYTVFPVNKENSESLEMELSKFSPHHNFPIIIDRSQNEAEPVAIFEPSAILMYLAEKSGQLMPQIPSGKFEVLQWLLFENSKIGPIFGNTKHFMFHATESVPYAVKRFNHETKRICSIIEKQLAENPFLAGGEYSIADIAAFPWIKDFDRLGVTEDEIPNTCEWLERITQRKAAQTGWDALANLKE